MKYVVNRVVRVVAVAATVVAVWTAGLGQAHGDPKTLEKIEQQNREAMENYDLLDYESAKRGLNEALALAKRSRLDRHPIKAQTHLYLGIVELSGFGDQQSALLQFMEAVEIDSAIQVPAAYRTPDLTTLLDTARAEVGGNAADPPAGSTSEASQDVDCEAVSGIEHKLADVATLGQDREIDAYLGDDVGAASVGLFYRPPGDDRFTKVQMVGNGCRYTGVIPASAIRGEFLHYYVVALSDSGKALAAKGSAGSPNIIEVTRGAGAVEAVRTTGDTENPLDAVELRGNDELSERQSESVDKTFFLAATVGSGGGFVTGDTESTEIDVGCCFAMALLHVLPELGFYLSPRTTISGAFRLGFPIGANIDGHSTAAPSGMVRLRYALSEDGGGMTLSGTLGAGVMRNTIKLKNPEFEDMDTDTVALGPAIAGVGVGYITALGGPLLFNFEVNALAGVPVVDEFSGVATQFGIQLDVDLGIMLAF